MRFSPLVAVESAPAPESLLLDITGVAHLFGGETALLETVAGDFISRGWDLRAAVADTIGAAWAIAHFGKSFVVPPSGGFSAGFRLKPVLRTPEYIVVPSDATLALLRPLPIEALRLPEPTVALLHQLGIRRIEQLEAIPREELSSRFGPHLLEQWDRAVGRLAEPLPTYEPPPAMAASWSAEYPTDRRETIEAALEHLAGRVAALLLQRGCGAMQLECRLECVSGEPVRISVGLFHPTAWAKHLVELLRVRLDVVRIASPVRSVHLAATLAAPLELRQQELFSDGFSRRHPRHWSALIDRLSNRLGHAAVMRVRLLPDAQPELAYRYFPMVARRGRAASRGAAAPEMPPRPLRLLTAPAPLAAGLPSQFRFSGRLHQVAQTWGPERIETGWWRGQAAARDYYRIETTTGRRFWIFRRLQDDRWFLHGVFE